MYNIFCYFGFALLWWSRPGLTPVVRLEEATGGPLDLEWFSIKKNEGQITKERNTEETEPRSQSLQSAAALLVFAAPLGQICDIKSVTLNHLWPTFLKGCNPSVNGLSRWFYPKTHSGQYRNSANALSVTTRNNNCLIVKWSLQSAAALLVFATPWTPNIIL